MKIEVDIAPSMTLAEFCDKHGLRVRLNMRRDETWCATIDGTVRMGQQDVLDLLVCEDGNTANHALRTACRVISKIGRYWPDPYSPSKCREWNAPRISGIFAENDWETAELSPPVPTPGASA